MAVGIVAVAPHEINAADINISQVGAWNTSSKLNGDPANDIAELAYAQNGQTPKNLGLSGDWCAKFVSECAKRIGQSTAVPYNAAAGGLYEAVIKAGGYKVSSPKKGDLVFYYCTASSGGWCHVAIMTDSTYSVHGNYADKVAYVNYSNYYDKIGYYSDPQVKCWTATFVRPNYSGNNTHTTHSYDTYVYNWDAHPHYKCYKCSCGDVKENRNEPTYVTTCNQCVLSDVYMNCSKKALPVGETNTFTFGATNAINYLIGINKNGQRIITEEATSGKSYTFNEAGEYTAYVTCRSNANGENIDSSVVSFTVFEPVILGEKFTANITSSITNKYIGANDSSNVELQNKQDSDNQKWIFQLQSDDTYKITNVAYKKCIDVNNWLTADGTNIGIHTDNSTTAQRFYIRATGSGFSIVPQCNTSSALDITDNSDREGANIQEWTWNGDAYQTFVIEYTDLVPQETQEFNGNRYEYYDLSMPWSQAYRFCEKQGGHLVTISSAEENNMVLNMANKYGKSYCWLGATDYSSEGKWYWVKPEGLIYKNWAITQPDNYYSAEHFMTMYTTGDIAGQWNDIANVSASQKKTIGFVCEYDNVIADEYSPSRIFSIDDKKYEVYDLRVDWQTAQKICEAKGGHLVVFENSEENLSVVQEIQGAGMQSYWIGYADVDSEGEWQSVSSVNSYTNWKANEPGNDFGCEDYALIRQTSPEWEDFKGYSYGYFDIGFICEYEAEEPKILLGDANEDDKVSIQDATTIQKHIASILTLSEDGCTLADVDASGDINIKDATAIQKHIAGIDTGYDIG